VRIAEVAQPGFEGPQLNRFSFHETDCLAHDLAKLMPQTTIAFEAEFDAARFAPSESPTAFPGIVLLYDGRPCAAMGYSREPSSTVVISPPIVLIDATDDIRRDIYGVLLRRMMQRSVQTGFLQINFLQHDSSVDSLFLSLLAERSFVPAATILQWELSTSPGSAAHQADLQNSNTPVKPRHGDCTLHRFDITNTEDDEVHEVQTALDAILRSSDDLPSQPRPRSDELLERWQALQASILMCRTQGKIAGILSYVKCMATEPAREIQKACAAEAVSKSYLSLEYIGVVYEFRRRQLASWLIGQMRLLHQSVRSVEYRSVSDVTAVKAFSDAANSPATALYESQGFVLAAEMQLWCCELKSDQSEKILPAWR